MPIKSYHLRSLKSYVVKLELSSCGGLSGANDNGCGKGSGGKSDEMARVTVNCSNVHMRR